MKEYIELLEKMANEISEKSWWAINKDVVLWLIRKYLNPFDPEPKDTFNTFRLK